MHDLDEEQLTILDDGKYYKFYAILTSFAKQYN
jgi:hypothetical protein